MKRVLVVCQTCGKDFGVHPYRSTTARFCSRACHGRWQSQQLGGTNPKWKRRVVRCAGCGKSFSSKLDQLKRGWGRFCSQSCRGQWQAQLWRGDRSPVWKAKATVCLQCGAKMFVPPNRLQKGGGKFCSKDCHYRWNSINQRGPRHHQWSSVVRDCLNCGERVFVQPNLLRRGGGKYCSPRCRTHHMRAHGRFGSIKPTKPERWFEALCAKHGLPYRYVGDGRFWIEGVNPDFVNTNGRKVAVEIFGTYWHDPQRNPSVKYPQTLGGRKQILRQYGWDCIIIWENELEEESVLERLREAGAI